MSFSIDDIDTVCAKLLHELQYASVADKQTYLRELIESIYAGERSSADVEGRIPILTHAQNIQYVTVNRDSRSSQCW